PASAALGCSRFSRMPAGVRRRRRPERPVMGEPAHQAAKSPAQGVAPKAPAAEPMPSPADLVNSKTTSLDGLSPEPIVGQLTVSLNLAHTDLTEGLRDAIERLKETNPPPKNDDVLAAIAKVVEVVTGFVLSTISHGAFAVLEKHAGEEVAASATFDAA